MLPGLCIPRHGCTKAIYEHSNTPTDSAYARKWRLPAIELLAQHCQVQFRSGRQALKAALCGPKESVYQVQHHFSSSVKLRSVREAPPAHSNFSRPVTLPRNL